MKVRQGMVLHLVFVLFAVQVFSEQGEEEAQPENDSFGGLKLEVLFDPEVSNEEIHTLVSQGLKHNIPKIVESTVGAIIFYVNLNRIQVEEKRQLPEFDRRLQDVPDLYDKLIAMWDTN